MIYALRYALDCDICHERLAENDNQFRLYDLADAEGWKLRRRKDGEYAGRGGNDYCPKCQPDAWKVKR